MTTTEAIDALVEKYRSRCAHYFDRVTDRGLTQEYRTWHYIKAETLKRVLRDLEALRGPEPVKKTESTAVILDANHAMVDVILGKTESTDTAPVEDDDESMLAELTRRRTSKKLFRREA